MRLSEKKRAARAILGLASKPAAYGFIQQGGNEMWPMKPKGASQQGMHRNRRSWRGAWPWRISGGGGVAWPINRYAICEVVVSGLLAINDNVF